MTWVLRHPQKSQGPDRHWGHDISNFGAHYGELTEIIICECLYCNNIVLRPEGGIFLHLLHFFSESCFAEWEEKLLTSWGCFCVNHIRYIYISIVDLFWRKKKVPWILSSPTSNKDSWHLFAPIIQSRRPRSQGQSNFSVTPFNLLKILTLQCIV